MASASFGASPLPMSSGFSRLRAQNRKPAAAAPIAKVIRFAEGSAIASPQTVSGSESPATFTPRICFIWLAAMITPEAVMNPATTGCERKFARNPSFSTPIATSISPDSSASASAAP